MCSKDVPRGIIIGELRKDSRAHCLGKGVVLLDSPKPGDHVSNGMGETSPRAYIFRVPSAYLGPIQAPVRPLGQRLAPSILPALRMALADPGEGRRAVGS